MNTHAGQSRAGMNWQNGTREPRAIARAAQRAGRAILRAAAKAMDAAMPFVYGMVCVAVSLAHTPRCGNALRPPKNSRKISKRASKSRGPAPRPGHHFGFGSGWLVTTQRLSQSRSRPMRSSDISEWWVFFMAMASMSKLCCCASARTSSVLS